MGLRERSIKAVAWSAADTCGRQGIGVVISIALARLISPAEFGVVGMAAFFLALGEVFVDGGFSAALIQRKDITEADKSSVLFYNIVMGLVMCAAMFVAAPWIAAFYRQPLLTGITRLLALNIVVGAGGAVQMALFRRDLNFKTPWKIGMAATGISGVIALVMASRGYGVWSLAMQAVIASVVSTSLLWASSPWRPGRVVDTASLRSLGKFGSRLLASDLLNTGFDKIQLLIIGKAFSAADLGHYTRAYSTRQLPASLLSTIVTKVTFPVFSTIADDERRLKAAVRQSLKAVTLVTMPMMLGLAVLAGPLVEVLFGKAWLPCVPYLALLSISGAIYPLHVVNLSAIQAGGRSDLFLRAEFVKRVLIGIGLASSVWISLTAMVCTGVFVSFLSYLVNASFAQRVIRYSISEQVRDVARPLAAAAAAAAVAGAIAGSLAGRPLVCLVTGALGGASAFLLAALCLRIPEVTAVGSMVTDYWAAYRRCSPAHGNAELK